MVVNLRPFIPSYGIAWGSDLFIFLKSNAFLPAMGLSYLMSLLVVLGLSIGRGLTSLFWDLALLYLAYWISVDWNAFMFCLNKSWLIKFTFSYSLWKAFLEIGLPKQGEVSWRSPSAIPVSAFTIRFESLVKLLKLACKSLFSYPCWKLPLLILIGLDEV